MKLAAKTTDELQKIHQEALEQYEDFKSLHLQLNMARGKPAPSSWTWRWGCWNASMPQ